MINPVLQNSRSRLIYLMIWGIIMMSHASFLYFQYDLPVKYANLDSLVYNIFFLLFGIGIWYIVRYNDFEIKRIPNLVAGHLLSAVLLLVLWITSARFTMRLLTGDLEFLAFSEDMIPAKIAFGVFYYLIIILVYYLFIYYENFKERIRKEASRETKYKEAELNTLKSQINPHLCLTV